MVKRSEKQIENRLKTIIEDDLGGWCIKFVPMFITGFPDRICLLPGARIFFVELKAPGKKPKKIQQYIHRKLIALDFKVYVVDSYEQIDNIKKQYDGKI